MTETTTGRRAVSEITRASYEAITDIAHDLHTRIYNLMEHTDGPRDPAWEELYDLMQLANVISNSAGRYAKRAALPREPVDYRPAIVHGLPGHYYDAMTCDDCAAIVVPF